MAFNSGFKGLKAWVYIWYKNKIGILRARQSYRAIKGSLSLRDGRFSVADLKVSREWLWK